MESQAFEFLFNQYFLIIYYNISDGIVTGRRLCLRVVSDI